MSLVHQLHRYTYTVLLRLQLCSEVAPVSTSLGARDNLRHRPIRSCYRRRDHLVPWNWRRVNRGRRQSSSGGGDSGDHDARIEVRATISGDEAHTSERHEDRATRWPCAMLKNIVFNFKY